MKLFGITEHGKLQEIALLGRDKTKPRETRLDHYLSFLLQAEPHEQGCRYQEIKVVIPYAEAPKFLNKDSWLHGWHLYFPDVQVVSETLLDNGTSLLVVLRPADTQEESCWTLEFSH